MSQDPSQIVPADNITQAFEALRGEVSLTRAALEGLTAARERMPDYSVTLGQILQELKGTSSGVARIEASPAVKISQSARTAEIIAAGVDVRDADHAMLRETRDMLQRSIGRIDGIVERGQAADRQWRRVILAAITGVLAGAVLMTFLPGAVARSLPASWHVPEWMAARVLRLPQRSAGVGMIMTAEKAAKL